MEQSPSWEANRFSVKKFPLLYGTRIFITTFTSVRHLYLTWASSIHSIPSHRTSSRSILILSSHPRLGLPSGLFPSGFPTTALHTPQSWHTSPKRKCTWQVTLRTVPTFMQSWADKETRLPNNYDTQTFNASCHVASFQLIDKNNQGN
jgi:hypothetical protein